MAFDTKALILFVGVLLATVLLISSEELTPEQLQAQNQGEKITGGRSIVYGPGPIGPRRRYPPIRPGSPYTGGCYKLYRCYPPSENGIHSAKPHH